MGEVSPSSICDKWKYAIIGGLASIPFTTTISGIKQSPESTEDQREVGDRFALVGVYDVLIGDDTCDPFTDSSTAVDAFENEEWLSLRKHNFADILRTHELAVLAGRFVPRSDFSMRNLAPPRH